MTVPSLPTLDRTVHAAIVWTLLDNGFPREDAEAWADGWATGAEPSMVAVQAMAYDDHGIPLSQAIEWHQRGFWPGEATCFYDARYTPEQAETLVILARATDGDVDEWVATGLPADRVIRYLHAGVSLDEVGDFEAAATGPDGPLDMLAALLG